MPLRREGLVDPKAFPAHASIHFGALPCVFLAVIGKSMSHRQTKCQVQASTVHFVNCRTGLHLKEYKHPFNKAWVIFEFRLPSLFWTSKHVQ